MSTYKMTLPGLYNWDDSIFNDMTLPTGIDKDVLIDNILITAGDFELLWSDPEFLRGAIAIWSRKWYRTFDKWVKALNLSYDPIYNYDRHEEWITDDTGNQSSDSKDSSNAHTDTENKISAFNSDTMSPDTYADSDSTSSSSSELTAQHANKEVRKGRAYGNIGVTTSQQMLQSELDLASWNLIEHITDIFLSEFIIPVF